MTIRNFDSQQKNNFLPNIWGGKDKPSFLFKRKEIHIKIKRVRLHKTFDLFIIHIWNCTKILRVLPFSKSGEFWILTEAINTFKKVLNFGFKRRMKQLALDEASCCLGEKNIKWGPRAIKAH